MPDQAIQMTGAIGESIVITELLWHGWLPANMNAIVRNTPNIDIVAVKGGTKIALQIKTAGVGSKAMVQLGEHKAGEPIFNKKDGPLCDYVVFVRLFEDKTHECYVVPVDVAEGEASKNAHIWHHTPKRDGTARKSFPAAIWFEPNKNRPDESNYKEKWREYLSMWDVC